MQTEQPLRLGDIVEITYTKKIVGFLYKMDDNEIVITNSPEVTGENQLFSVRTNLVTDLYVHNRPVASKLAQSAPQPEDQGPKVLRPNFHRLTPPEVS